MKSRAIALIAGANLLGGLSYFAQRKALDAGLPPGTITLGRNFVALIALGAWILARGDSFRAWTRRDWLRGALLGTLAFALPMALGVVGVGMSNASNGSILILIEPCAILFLCWLMLRERLGWNQIAGVALGLAGALCLVLEGAGEQSLADLFKGEYARGNLVLVAHAILWGLYTPISKPLALRHGAFEITFVSMLASLLVLVPWSALELAHWSAGPELGRALAWTAGLGLFVSFLSTVMWLAALRELRASAVGVFIFLQPITGCLSGWWFLGERLTAGALLGGLVIAAGIAVSLLGSDRAAARA